MRHPTKYATRASSSRLPTILVAKEGTSTLHPPRPAIIFQDMSSKNDHGRPRRSFPSRDERLRERVLQQFVRKWKLDNYAAQKRQRAVFGQCLFRFDAGGKFSFQLPGKITVNQQIRIAMPLRGLAIDYRERVIRQLEVIENIGGRVGLMVRGSLANPWSSSPASRPSTVI